MRSEGAAGAVKGWPLLDALRQPTQTSSRTGEDALPHLWIDGGCCGHSEVDSDGEMRLYFQAMSVLTVLMRRIAGSVTSLGVVGTFSGTHM